MKNHLSQIIAAIDWIEQHLDDITDSLSPAKMVGLSPYHFHRLFKSMTGMSPGLYIRRRLMTRAAQELLTNNSILSVAVGCGFDTQESFTRAFKTQFGMTPAKARTEESKIKPQYQRPLMRDDISFIAQGGVSLTPEIIHRDEFSVRGFRGEFDWSDTKNMNEMWVKFGAFLKQKNHTRNTAYGVCLGTTDSIWMKPRLEYMCGVEDLPDYPECTRVDVLSGDYAVFTHRGDLFDIQKTIAHIWQVWVPRMEFELRASPEFETYDDMFDVKTLSGDIKIWIPVVST